MSTETTLLHDGSMIAAANYGNGASLSGPGGSGQYLAVIESTAADRTALLASAIGQAAIGILQNKPAAAQAADVGFLGVSKFVAGGTITRGDKLMTDASGRLITWTAGSAYCQVGTARESAVVGQVSECFIHPAAVKVLT